MSYLAEQRKYQRGENVVCKALISVNETGWENVELCDVSAGGLCFVSSCTFYKNAKLYFNLYVYNMLSEFNIRLEGCIVRVDGDKGRYVYSVKFENINKYVQVQMDELVKSKVTVRTARENNLQEGQSSTFLFPGSKPRTHRINIHNY
jgi:hypothetical protein